MAQYIKIDGTWKQIVSVYKKVNGHWVPQTEYDFDDKIHFYNALEVDVDIFMIVAEDSYTGKQFYLVAKLNNTRVYPNWSITSGNQYATINSNGKVTILSGTNNSLITVHASYNGFGKDKNITVSYSNQLSIEGPSSMVGTSGNLIALYNSSLVSPNWSITSGNAYATIDTTGTISIIASGEITVSASYDGYTVTKTITLEYDDSTYSQTEVDEETGAVTTTETTTTTDPQTGAVTETTTSTTTNEDGSTSETQSETTTNTDGSSTTTETTTNSDGSSSSSTTNVSSADSDGTVTTETTSTVTNSDGTSSESTSTTVENEDGSSQSQSQTTHYDENGDTTGSTTNETNVNSDGSSQSTTTNYDSSGDPTDTTNVNTDTTGNVDTQNIEYDEQGNQTVVGYDINTEASEGTGKEMAGDGVNTEFVPFDGSGFICHIRFKSLLEDQVIPPVVEDIDDTGTNYLMNVMSAKSPTKISNRYPGFDIRWTIQKANPTSSNKNNVLQFRYAPAGEGNTQANFTPDADGICDITVTYDPDKLHNNYKFTVTSANGSLQTIQADKTFANLNMDFTIGYALSSQGSPYRYTNVTVYEFSITKIS